jgi:ubiquinone/menaquinone biosynthesis C-methylase UbiE
MRRPEFIARQSRCPTGLLGRVIGHIMERETAAANDAALTLLELQAGDRVLEVGFGHGRTIARAAAAVDHGVVAGIDPSEEMARMATRRCRRLVDAGRVRLARADGMHLPYPDQCFDKAYTIHTIYFWADPERHLRELRRVLRIGGRLVLGFRPKGDRGTEDFPASVYSFHSTGRVCQMLQQAGFEVGETPRAVGEVLLVTARRASV